MSKLNTLETPRLLIRIDTVEEYVRIFESFGNDALMHYFGFEDEAALETERQKVLGGLTTYRNSVRFFHLIEKASNLVVGSIAFHNWYVQHRRAEIGYGMRKEAFKGKGFMTEALMPVVDYGFRHMDLNRIEAFTGRQNIASQKLVTGRGFRQEAILKQHYNHNGTIEDSLLFALLREDYGF